MGEIKYAVLMPEPLYRRLEQMGKESGCEVIDLIKDAFEILLEGYRAQQKKGGVFIKSESQWEQGIQQRIGKSRSLDDFLKDLGIDFNESG